VVDFLIHYYRRGEEPFRSLTDLCDADALRLMRQLYTEGSVFWERFKDPEDYLAARRRIEAWMYDEFVAQGGMPQERRPIYMTLGRSRWAESVVDPLTTAMTTEIEVPLAIFQDSDVSFTYPDSMVSMMVAAARDPSTFQPGYHGELFTRERIREIVERKGMPEEGWETRVPRRLAHYIEVQVWNREPIRRWYRGRS